MSKTIVRQDLIPVFVYNIDKAMTQEEFYNKVKDITKGNSEQTLVIDGFSKQSKGFGFVFFNNTTDATAFVNVFAINKNKKVGWKAELSTICRDHVLRTYHNKTYKIKK